MLLTETKRQSDSKQRQLWPRRQESDKQLDGNSSLSLLCHPLKKADVQPTRISPSSDGGWHKELFFPPVVMAAVLKLEMGLNPWPVSSFAFSGLGGTAPDENGARAESYEWLFVWWSDTITNWVTQLTGSQSNAQFDSCIFFSFNVSHFLNVSCVPFFMPSTNIYTSTEI